MRLILLVLWLLCLGPGLHARQTFSRDYWLNAWNSPTRVYDLLADSGGYIWLATDNGLMRFNGRDFSPITTGRAVRALCLHQGRLWLGLDQGRLGFLQADSLQLYEHPELRQIETINSLRSAPGTLLISTAGQGLYCLANGTVNQLSSRHGLPDDYTYEAAWLPATRRLAVATDRGPALAGLEGGRPGIWPVTDSLLPDRLTRVLRPLDGTDMCWLGTQEGGLARLRFSGGHPVLRPLNQLWAWGQVNDIWPVSGTEAWVATETGYLLHVQAPADDRQPASITPYLLEGKKIYKLLADRAGNIWCATQDGLSMLSAAYATWLHPGNDYQLSAMTAMAFDRNNTLWYAQNERVYALEPGAPRPEGRLVFRAPAPVTSLCADSLNRLWIGTLGSGLWRRQPSGSTSELTHIPDLLRGHILSIASQGGRLWVSSLNGVEELEVAADGSLRHMRHHGKRSGIGSDYVYQIFPDRQGRVWMATDGAGISMYHNGTYTRWTDQAGLNSRVAYALSQDSRGRIWAASLQQGLCCFDGNRWQSIGRDMGLQDPNIAALAANASGQVVAVHSKGIDEWHPQSRQFLHYNRQQGLGIDSVSGVLNCIATDTAGRVWIPFEQGFICLDKRQHPPRLQPGIALRSVSLFLKPTSRSSFGASENHLSFAYEAISFARSENMHYRYQLQGFSQAWTPTSDELASFPQLPPGRYTFRVQASAHASFEQAAEASFSFVIERPLWQRPWFLLLAATALATAVWAWLRGRERSLRRLARLQRERMTFEYEHLKSQVNPHFLFNSLNTLASLIEEDPEAATHYTEQLSDLYRHMLGFRDRDLISLAEEWSLLEKYLFIQQSRFGPALQIKASIPGTLKQRQIVPLALQLLVENAIKHNVVSRAQPLIITIEATAESICVRHPLQPRMSPARGAGLGLANISSRYKLLGSRQIVYGATDSEYIVTLPLI